jgi:lysophospholipase L1-like esterase
MNKALQTILIIVGAIGGATGTYFIITAVNKGKRIPNSGNVLFVGDSYTAGNGSYADLLKTQFPNLNIKKIAKVGATTDWMVQNASNDISSGNYDGVVILGGVNDIYSRNSIDQTKKNLQLMYDQAKSAGSKVVGVTIAPTDYYDKYDAAKGKLTKELNGFIENNRSLSKVIELDKLFTKDAKQNLSFFVGDRLHPNYLGNKLLSGELATKAIS